MGTENVYVASGGLLMTKLDIAIHKVETKAPHVSDKPKRKEFYDERWLGIFLKGWGDGTKVKCSECQTPIKIFDNTVSFYFGIDPKSPNVKPRLFCYACSQWINFAIGDPNKEKPAKYKNWIVDAGRLTGAFMHSFFKKEIVELYPSQELTKKEIKKQIIKYQEWSLLSQLSDQEILEFEKEIIESEPLVITRPDSSRIQRLYLFSYNNIQIEKFRRGLKE